MVWAISERWPAAGRRRSRARCTPTDAFSNMVSWWRRTVRAGGSERRGSGTVRRVAYRAGGLVRGTMPVKNGPFTVNRRLTDAKQAGKRTSAGREPAGASGVERLRQRPEELDVVLGLREAVEQQLDALVRADRRQHPAHGPDHLEDGLLEEQLLAASTGALDVDRGEDPLLGELPIEDQLAVAGALELLVDDVVHARAGVDEAGGDDRERATLLYVPRGTEE